MISTERVNKSNDEEEVKKKNRNRLYELSLKSIGKSPELENLNDEQKQWIKSWRPINEF